MYGTLVKPRLLAITTFGISEKTGRKLSNTIRDCLVQRKFIFRSNREKGYQHVMEITEHKSELVSKIRIVVQDITLVGASLPQDLIDAFDEVAGVILKSDYWINGKIILEVWHIDGVSLYERAIGL